MASHKSRFFDLPVKRNAPTLINVLSCSKPALVPKHFDKTGDEVIPEAYVDEETFYKMQGFKKYMDSLKQNKSKQYDSIMQARPGLMDSVQVLEEIYYSQKQK